MADVLTTFIMNVLHKYKLLDNFFCGDRCNTHFGGAARRGTNNIFAKLENINLDMNIQSTGCAVRICIMQFRPVLTFYRMISRP